MRQAGYVAQKFGTELERKRNVEDVGWMCVAQDRDQWQPLMNMVVNLQVS
jgi:hypothetical protein